jgi:hypothetical protein
MKKVISPDIGANGFRAQEFFKGFLGNPELGLQSMRNMYFGIELEVNLLPRTVREYTGPERQKDKPRKDVAKKLFKTTKDFAIYTHDGSIPYGFEIKTAPATYEYHLNAWKPFFDLVESEPQLLQTYGDNCGIHIHLRFIYT